MIASSIERLDIPEMTISNNNKYLSLSLSLRLFCILHLARKKRKKKKKAISKVDLRSGWLTNPVVSVL